MAELTKKQQQEVKEEVAKQLSKRVALTVKEKSVLLRDEFKNQASAAIIAAFGFLIALSWKDFIIKIMQNITPPSLLTQYPYLAELYSAVLITFLSILAIMAISRWAKTQANIPLPM